MGRRAEKAKLDEGTKREKEEGTIPKSSGWRELESERGKGRSRIRKYEGRGGETAKSGGYRMAGHTCVARIPDL